ncbi:hypothetical protein Hanom_Chr16g01487131 [Helianthus anomalus]
MGYVCIRKGLIIQYQFSYRPIIQYALTGSSYSNRYELQFSYSVRMFVELQKFVCALMVELISCFWSYVVVSKMCPVFVKGSGFV